jgi:hypothetical protein
VLASDSKEDKWTATIKTSDGQVHKVNKGWVGYFERLTDLHIDVAIMY